jgi:hypothetical protein
MGMMNHSPRRSGGAGTCLLLLVILIGCSLAASVPVVALIIAPTVAGFFVLELDRNSASMSERMVTRAARLLPQRVRADLAEEWVSHVHEAGDAGLRPLVEAAKIAFVGAPWLACRLHGRRLAGSYLLSLVTVALEIARADAKEKRRGSWISTAKAALRINAIVMAPVLAVVFMLRFDIPRWLIYTLAAVSAFAISKFADGLPLCPHILTLLVPDLVLMSVCSLVVLKYEPIVSYLARLIGDDADA